MVTWRTCTAAHCARCARRSARRRSRHSPAASAPRFARTDAASSVMATGRPAPFCNGTTFMVFNNLKQLAPKGSLPKYTSRERGQTVGNWLGASPSEGTRGADRQHTDARQAQDKHTTDQKKHKQASGNEEGGGCNGGGGCDEEGRERRGKEAKRERRGKGGKELKEVEECKRTRRNQDTESQQEGKESQQDSQRVNVLIDAKCEGEPGRFQRG